MWMHLKFLAQFLAQWQPSLIFNWPPIICCSLCSMGRSIHWVSYSKHRPLFQIWLPLPQSVSLWGRYCRVCTYHLFYQQSEGRAGCKMGENFLLHQKWLPLHAVSAKGATFISLLNCPLSPSPHLPTSPSPTSPSPHLPLSLHSPLPCPILWQHSYKIITY